MTDLCSGTQETKSKLTCSTLASQPNVRHTPESRDVLLIQKVSPDAMDIEGSYKGAAVNAAGIKANCPPYRDPHREALLQTMITTTEWQSSSQKTFILCQGPSRSAYAEQRMSVIGILCDVPSGAACDSRYHRVVSGHGPGLFATGRHGLYPLNDQGLMGRHL